MARKSRKHQYTEMFRPSTANAVGYVRLSVANQEEFNSIQNQKFIIELWGDQHQIPISHYYIDNGFSGQRFDRPAFQKMIEDILAGKVNCVIVRISLAWEGTTLLPVTISKSFSQLTESDLYL